MHDRIFAGVNLLICVALIALAWGYQAPFAYEPVGPRAYPLLLLSLLVLGALYQVLKPAKQAEAREEQRRLNSELRATRALLAESSRMSERVRISRELHDLLGHHLTALSLNLEVAGHLTEGRAQEHVRQSHTLAKLLLTDVREAVSEMRDEGAIDLSGAIRTLVEGVPALDIRLDMPEPLTIEDPERAHVLLRCTQEIITNAVRHAGASTLWLTIARDAAEARIQARDDGAGVEGDTVPGNGLRGMRERLGAYGGRVDIITGRGQGFALDIRLPLENAA